jgi:hypothetical protein
LPGTIAAQLRGQKTADEFGRLAEDARREPRHLEHLEPDTHASTHPSRRVQLRDARKSVRW